MMPTYWRQRNDLVRSTGRHIQRMQKALTQMNLQLANVLSAVSGMARDAHKVAALRDLRVKASEERIAQSLEGNWQPDLLFLLKQETQSTPRPHPPPRSAAQQREA